MKYQISDGVKTVPLISEKNFFNGREYLTPQTAQSARENVAYVYRCVEFRARTLQTVPHMFMRGETDVTVQYQKLFDEITSLLYLIESSLILEGQAFVLKTRNVFGRNLSLQWLAPQTTTPFFTPTGVVDHFQRTTQAGIDHIAPNDMLAFWLPDPYREVGPGASPLQSILKAAGVLAGVDEFSRQFFERGATKVMLLTVDGTPTSEQAKKLETWWRRLISGVKNAYQSIVVSSAVKPQVVGDGLSDLDSQNVITPRRQDILAATGVSESFLLSSAANRATAQQERLNFLQSVVVPQANWIASVFNSFLRDEFGVELVFDPSLMEEYQASEFDKTMSLVPLFDSGILSKNEIRQALGYAPVDDDVQPLSPETDAMRAWKSAYDAMWERY